MVPLAETLETLSKIALSGVMLSCDTECAMIKLPGSRVPHRGTGSQKNRTESESTSVYEHPCFSTFKVCYLHLDVSFEGPSYLYQDHL